MKNSFKIGQEVQTRCGGLIRGVIVGKTKTQRELFYRVAFVKVDQSICNADFFECEIEPFSENPVGFKK